MKTVKYKSVNVFHNEFQQNLWKSLWDTWKIPQRSTAINLAYTGTAEQRLVVIFDFKIKNVCETVYRVHI
jgi:hypothetical protein